MVARYGGDPRYRIERGGEGALISLEEMMRGKILCREKRLQVVAILTVLFSFRFGRKMYQVGVCISRDKSLKNGA